MNKKKDKNQKNNDSKIDKDKSEASRYNEEEFLDSDEDKNQDSKDRIVN